MKWEYKTAHGNLNAHGADGWEVIHVFDFSPTSCYVLMKRPLVTADDIKLEAMQPVPEEAQAEVAAFLAKMARRQP